MQTLRPHSRPTESGPGTGTPVVKDEPSRRFWCLHKCEILSVFAGVGWSAALDSRPGHALSHIRRRWLGRYQQRLLQPWLSGLGTCLSSSLHSRVAVPPANRSPRGWLQGQGHALQPLRSPWTSLAEECPDREGLTSETVLTKRSSGLAGETLRAVGKLSCLQLPWPRVRARRKGLEQSACTWLEAEGAPVSHRLSCSQVLCSWKTGLPIWPPCIHDFLHSANSPEHFATLDPLWGPEYEGYRGELDTGMWALPLRLWGETSSW